MSVNDQLKGGYQGFQVLNSTNALTFCKIFSLSRWKWIISFASQS